MTRQTVTLYSAQTAPAAIRPLLDWCKAMLIAGHRLIVEARTETRSLAQNNMMMACLEDLSRQVTIGGKRFTRYGWKDYITAHLNGQDLVPNMDGTGFIAIGRGSSTSDMTKGEMTAVIDLCHTFGAERGVRWSPASVAMDTEDV